LWFELAQVMPSRGGVQLANSAFTFDMS